MFRDLLLFEWRYHTRKPLFYITSFAFLAIGFLTGYSGNIAFPNVHINSPYQLSFLTGILSMAAIFSITLSVAQGFLREADSRFDTIIYATPVSKLNYLSGRLLSVTVAAIISFAMAVAGLYIGNLLSQAPSDKKGVFLFINYAWPLLVLAIPNIILCIAVLCSTAWITRNKLIIYVAGLLIYVLYIIGSIFANSPLIAGAAPASPEQLSLFAKLDPLGMAAFFEQTRYWTALERNTIQLSLTGNFLVNRTIWLIVSILLLAVSYRVFSFRKLQGVRARKIKPVEEAPSKSEGYIAVVPRINTWKHYISSVRSFFRMDVATIFKGIPFVLVLIIWTVLLTVELLNAVNGDPRLGGNYARTGLLISTIMEVTPSFAIIIMLFYSSELLWKSRAVHFDMLENTTPVHPVSVLTARLLSIAAIPLFLVAFSCVLAMLVQLSKGHPVSDIWLYASLFYFTGIPLVLCAVLMVCIQAGIKNKYAGLAVAAVVVLLTTSNIGRLIGIRHPLLRFANAFAVPHGDMNGFGSYVTAFHWQLLYWGSLAACIVLFTVKSMRKAWIIIPAALLVFSGGYIFYQANIKHPYLSSSAINDWKQDYEASFKRYEHLPQPTITDVKATVDLFPVSDRYEVSGEYTMVNLTTSPIDSLLLYIDRNTTLREVTIQHAKLLKDQSEYGHYWYIMEQPMQPGDSTRVTFSFSSGWSPFKGHAPFNSIIGNGSFIRISNYFPSFGYESANELSNSIERSKRSMKAQAELNKLEMPLDSPYNYKFINLDVTVSTEADQLAVGSGKLLKQWTLDGRNHFHYKSEAPMPFRFAFSSARYSVKKDVYRDIPIEVYYHPQHAANVDSLIANTKRTLQYCEDNFGDYPHSVIRFAEVSQFAEGFAATAYPGTIYMKEDGGFHNNLSKGSKEDIINQLAGHELSHQWWGSDKIVPEYKEGAWILTETLAKHTELMLYLRAHGLEATLDIIRQHTDLYLGSRSFSRETPLYKTTFETPHLPYNKGSVVMYQLYHLIGENAVNNALRSFYQHHSFPGPPPSSQDLLNELYKASPQELHHKIDELFKDIIIYDLKMEEAAYTGNEVSFSASVYKYKEDGLGKKIGASQDSTIEMGVYTSDGKMTPGVFSIKDGHVTGKLKVEGKPVRVVIDPYLKKMDSFLKDNEKELSY